MRKIGIFPFYNQKKCIMTNKLHTHTPITASDFRCIKEKSYLLLLTLIIIALFASCTKDGRQDEILKSTVLEQAHKMDPGQLPPDSLGLIPYLESESTLPPIYTNGITNENGVLHIPNMAVFDTLISTLMNHNDSVLNLWEDGLGFTSLRRLNYNLEQDDLVDDLLLSQTRIPDVSFETVLNTENKIRIEDTLYQVDLLNEKVYTINLINSERDTIDFAMAPSGCVECNYAKVTFCDELQNDGSKVEGKKWNRYYGFYMSFGVRTTFYKKNANGKWKKSKAYEIFVWLDHYNDTRWNYRWIVEGTCPNVPWNYIPTNEPKRFKKRENAKTVARTFQYFATSSIKDALYRYQEICVNKFGRVHHWTVNFNDDCHNENW